MRFRNIVLFLLIFLVSCGPSLPPGFVFPSNPELLARTSLDIHVHPETPNLIASVEDAMSVVDTIRIQVDFDGVDSLVPQYVIDVAKAVSAQDKTLIVILGVSPNPAINNPETWESEAGVFFSKLITLLKNTPSLGDIVFEIGNEPDYFCAGNQQFSFSDFVFPNCSMTEYLEYLRVVRAHIEPIITIHNLIGDGEWQMMVAATIPWHQSGRIEMNRELLASEHTKGMIFNLHIYDPQYPLLVPLMDVYQTAREQGREVWVTETGSKFRQLNFIRDTYSILSANGLEFGRVIIYAYNDDTLGFSLVRLDTDTPQDSDLMYFMRSREASPDAL